jgi:hypothetical protein
MALLTFPLSLAGFADGLRVRSFGWDLSENRRTSETSGGEILVADLGPRLWRGSVQIAPTTYDGQRSAQALAQALRSGSRSFFLSPYKAQYPAADPDGSTLGAATPSLQLPVGGFDTVDITGLPEGYILTPGDYFSFEYGSDPVRYALHQIVAVSGPADVTGTLTAQFVGRLRPGVADGTEIRLVKPFCKVLMVPGSFSASTAGLASASGFSFDFQQTLR